MFVIDGKGIIRKIWGGYSPKIYDGMFVESHKDEFIRLFNGIKFLADNHFRSVDKTIGNIRFICNYAIRNKDQKAQEDRAQPQNFDAEDTVKTKKNFNAI